MTLDDLRAAITNLPADATLSGDANDLKVSYVETTKIDNGDGSYTTSDRDVVITYALNLNDTDFQSTTTKTHRVVPQ